MPWSSFHRARPHWSQQFFPVSVHLFIRKRHAPNFFWFSILQWKEETLLQYSTSTAQLGGLLQLPSVCCVLPMWVCIGLSYSTAGEKDRDSPKVSGAAKGCGYSVHCLQYQFKVLLLLQQMGWYNSVGLRYNVASGAGLPLRTKTML